MKPNAVVGAVLAAMGQSQEEPSYGNTLARTGKYGGAVAQSMPK
jgi:hypothetical protein